MLIHDYANSLSIGERRIIKQVERAYWVRLSKNDDFYPKFYKKCRLRIAKLFYFNYGDVFADNSFILSGNEPNWAYSDFDWEAYLNGLSKEPERNLLNFIIRKANLTRIFRNWCFDISIPKGLDKEQSKKALNAVFVGLICTHNNFKGVDFSDIADGSLVNV